MTEEEIHTQYINGNTLNRKFVKTLHQETRDNIMKARAPSTKGYSRWTVGKSLGKIISTIRAHASPKKGQNKVSQRVSVPCWHATPIAHDQWKLLLSTKVKISIKSNLEKRSWVNVHVMYDLESLVLAIRTYASLK